MDTESQFFVTNIAKVFPSHSIKVVDYKKGFYKYKEGWSRRREWDRDYNSGLLLESYDDFLDRKKHRFDQISGFDQTLTQIPMSWASNYKQFIDHSTRSRLIIEYDIKLQRLQALEVLRKSLTRSKRNVIDLVYNNNFELWVTFTFAGEKRSDIDWCRNKLSDWFEYQKKLYGNFSYLVVMELHKDGSPHFHGLLNNYKGLVIPAKSPYTGQDLFRTHKGVRYQQFNLGNYKLGFTSVEKIANKYAVAQYMTKYLTKDMTTFKGKKRYFASRDLVKPAKEYNTDYLEYNDSTVGYEADGYTVKYIDLSTKNKDLSTELEG